MSGYLHREAFCLMAYASRDRSEERVIWNSRDGVTPFGCSDPDTGIELTHVDWHRDRCEPLYTPVVGEWVWDDLHPERAFEHALANTRRWWDDPRTPMRDHPYLNPAGGDGEDAIRRAAATLAASYLDPPGQPDLVQVTDPWLAALDARRSGVHKEVHTL